MRSSRTFPEEQKPDNTYTDLQLTSLVDRSHNIPVSPPASYSNLTDLISQPKNNPPQTTTSSQSSNKTETKMESKTTTKDDTDPKKKAKSLLDADTDENHEIDINDLFQGLETPIEYNKLLVPANASNIDEIVKAANAEQSPAAAMSVVGKLIEPGKIGIIDYNGKIQIIGPGRWIFPNPRASLVKIASLLDNVIKYETLTIIRISRGEIGLASENGAPFILSEGIHVRNTRVFQFIKTENVNQQYLKHGSIHVLRVPQGFYGLVTENARPKLLQEGVHVTNSNVFQFDGLQLINQPYIKHGTIHILRIPKGKVALVSDNNRPKLLEGTHCITSKVFTFQEMQDLTQQVIKHGTITRFRVRKGEIGLGWENNEPVFFQEGIYEKDSPNFAFEKCVSAGEKVISLGSKKIVTVFDGEVGVSYLKGKLVVLRPDRHLIESAEHVFQGFLSTQQQCLHLVRLEKDKDGILTCETKDFVEIGLYADVFYKIKDPEKTLMIVGKDNVTTLVRETAIATLNSIIRSTALGEIAQNKEFSAKSERQHQQPTATLFFDKVHDEFISKLHDNFMDQFGIDIMNIRIESFKIMNAELANNISKQALVTAQTENQLANLTGQTEIATAQQKRDAEVARIRAEGEAIRLKTETDARNKATMETAKAEADATVIRAKAEAQAIELKAEAEAKAILLKAEAEAKKAEMIGKTSLGSQLAVFEMYAKMVTSSMQGVQKVIYLPSGEGSATNNPMAFLAMQPNMISGLVQNLTNQQ